MQKEGLYGEVQHGPAWCQVMFGKFGLVWYVQFGLVNEDDLKGNMHHKHDVSSKDAFYIIDLAADICF